MLPRRQDVQQLTGNFTADLGRQEIVQQENLVVMQSNALRMFESPAVRIAPRAELLVQIPVGEDQARVRQGGHEDRGFRGSAGDRVDHLHFGASPVHLHRASRFVGDHDG